jgi:hypothetical protein
VSPADAALAAERRRARVSREAVHAAAARATLLQRRFSADNLRLEALAESLAQQRDALHRVCIGAVVRVASLAHGGGGEEEPVWARVRLPALDVARLRRHVAEAAAAAAAAAVNFLGPS